MFDLVNQYFIRKNNTKYFLPSFFLLIVFLTTTHTFSYEESISYGYKDIETYSFISTNGFESGAAQKYYNHHLERWPIHISVGLLSRLLNINVWSVYRIAILILIFFCYISIKSLNISEIKKIAIFSLILFNPYTFRSFYAAPGMISDCALLVSFLLVICGILNNNNLQISSGVFLSVISRQTSILLIPIIITLYFLNYLRLRYLLIYVFILISGFLGIKYFTVQFYGAPDSDYFIKHAFGIFSWISNSFSIENALSFFGRYFLFILTLSGFILILNKESKHALIFIAIFLFVHLQPLAGGPLVTGGNIQRLSALGLPFLIPLIVYSNASNQSFIYFILISVIVSFHHQRTFIYYFDNGIILFFLLVLSSFPISLYLKYSSSKIKN